jgi:adenylate cyclase
MAPESFKRKLTAILSADVKGYSRLMGDNEAETVKTLTAYRKIMGELIQQHRGRVIDSPGDNILAEFGSVVDAVQCSVAAQNEFKARNAELPENRRMVFRIGVNLGDVIEEESRIYGDGVNIAARLEALAEPGGICISKTAFDHIETKLPLGYEYLGEQTVKNIAKPVGAYKVLMEPRVTGTVRPGKAKEIPVWRGKPVLAGAVAVLVVILGVAFWNFYFRAPRFEPASKEKMAFPLPDKPSIAVLPFENMSGNPEQEYFSDGITEEIITALSKTPKLFVIARTSSFKYKGKEVDVRTVGRELGVEYVMEGSVRKAGDKVRITAQLIDAQKNQHLWAERYDRAFEDIFAIQDEITMKIVTAMRVKLTEGEQARLLGKRAKNLDVYLKAMEAHAAWSKGTKEGYIRFGQLAQEIVDMAPESALGYRDLAWYYWVLATRGKSPRESLAKSFKLAQKAIEIDKSDSSSYTLLGSIYLYMRKYEEAIAAGKRAITLNPNGALDHDMLGYTLNYAGMPDEAIDHFRLALRLNPFPDFWYFRHLGQCYMLKGQYAQALEEYKKALHQSPDAAMNYAGLTVIYTLLDRLEEARAAAKKLIELYPEFSVEGLSKALPYKNEDDLKLVVDALRKAGLK